MIQCQYETFNTLVTFQSSALIYLPNMKQIRQAFISEPCGSCLGPLLETRIFGRPLLNTATFRIIRLSFMPKRENLHTAFSVKTHELQICPFFDPLGPILQEPKFCWIPNFTHISRTITSYFNPIISKICSILFEKL